MVLAYHVIFGAYGYWLPNDPRGSCSDRVWAEHLQRFGPATKVTSLRSHAHDAHDVASRLEAKAVLLYPAVRFSQAQVHAVAEGFAAISAKLNIVINACAIMPDHVHLVVRRHGERIEVLTGFLKRAATRAMNHANVHPLRCHRDRRGRMPSPWAEDGWFVYLDSLEKVASRIAYVEENPIKAGLPRQVWPFVVPWEG